MLKPLFLLTIFTSWYISAESIRVVTEHLPPYQIVKNGQVVGGSSYAIMKEVLKRAKIDVIHEALPWARAYKTALSRDNTIIYSITRSLEREPLFRWIGQLYSQKYSFFSAKANKNIHIKTTSDALNYMAVAVRDSFEADSLQHIGFEVGGNLMLVVDYSTVWKMLHMGRADITYADSPVHGGSNLDESLFKKQGVHIEALEVYVAANINTDEKVLDNLSAALQSVKKDPLFKKLFNIQKKKL